MRILILLCLLLLAGNAFAQPTPREWINPFTTNRPPQPVFGDNNVAISNRIAGAGGGTSWNFYGISPNTVARLTDSTNIAKAQIASSNANYVLKFNGASDGQTATNFTLVGNLSTPLSQTWMDANGNGFLRINGGTLTLAEDYSTVSIRVAQTNTSTLNVADVTHLFGDLYLPSSALHVYGDKSDFSNSVAFYQPAVSKLAAFDALHHLTNSAYSDQTIADLQAATNSLQTQLTAATNALNVASNALRTAVGTTNQYILTNGGTGFLTQLYSPTNTVQASNQVVATFKGVTGQTNNLLEWGTNNASGNMIRQGVIDHNGNVGISTNAPAVALDVIGAGHFSGNLTTVGNMTCGANAWVIVNNNVNLQNSAAIVVFNSGTEEIYHYGTGTNGFGTTGATPNGSIEVSNAVFRGAVTVTGTFTSKSTIFAPTNTAPVNTIVSGGLHVLTLGKGWTNDLGGRADLVMQVKFTDAATGDPSFAFTNTTSGVSWTNGIAFGIAGSDTRTIVEPDINPSDTGSITDLSGTGASVTILQAWWKVK